MSEIEFTVEELQPLIAWLKKEPIPTEKHYPGIHAVIKKLMEVELEEKQS